MRIFSENNLNLDLLEAMRVLEERLREIQQVLVQQRGILTEILERVRRLENYVNEGRAPHRFDIRDRKLRLLRVLLEFNEDICLSRLAENVGASIKTIQRDLIYLAKLGLASYTPSKSRRCNPGRRGNKPRLTRRGRRVALKAYELDGTPEKTWLKELNNF